MIIDLKYGAGIAVEAVGNSQLVYYALAIAAKYDFNFSKVKMTIYQPRAYHEAGAWRSWEISIEELLKWVDVFKEGAKRVKKETKTYNSGEWCKFCPATLICPAIAKGALAQARIDFDPKEDRKLTLPDPKDIDPKTMSTILRKADGLKAWLSQVEEYAFDLMNRGGKIDGYKLVAKRGKRVWADAEKASKEAKKTYGDAAFTKPVLLSPAQLAEIAPKEWIDKRTVNISSGLTLAKEEDKRTRTTSASLDFNDGITKKEITHDRKKESSKKGSKEKSNEEAGKKGGGKKESASKESRKKESGKKKVAGKTSGSRDYGF